MTATDRTRRQSTADRETRPARIESVTRDLPHIGPDCRDGKHPACDGRAWDDEADDITDCHCHCHAPTIHKAMVLEFADGHREHSPHVALQMNPDGTVSVTPIEAFQRIP